MQKCKRVVFLSEMKNPNKDASSTQIMTKNLLHGLRNICEELVFVSIISNREDIEDISSYYRNLADEILYVDSITKNTGNPYMHILSMIKACTIYSYKRQVDVITRYISDDTIIITHSPSIDSALYAGRIKKRFPTIKYVQYWGDPEALSLITPEEMNYKRYPLYWIEKYLHKSADRIVYGTESLYVAQKQLYKESQDKIFKCDVSYQPDNMIEYVNNNNKPVFGYFGNYFSNIRDIKPLYDAFTEIEEAQLLICGNSDKKYECTDNIAIHSRVPQSQIKSMEAKEDVIVCILNRVGVQTPGKVFYQTNCKQPILVIIDGPYKNIIKADLERFERFVFCENDKDSIKAAVKKMIGLKRQEYDVSTLAPDIICRQIIGI